MGLPERLNQLRCLRADIATLCIVKCRMSHERVLKDDASGLPVVCRFPAGSYQRVGLCAPELRARRLGCSHTSARIKLNDAITVLGASEGENNSADSRLSSEFVRLNNSIHLLDHGKGEAEKRLAGIMAEAKQGGGPADQEEKLKEAENEISEMEAIHDEYVEEIGRLRDRVVDEIDKLLKAERHTIT